MKTILPILFLILACDGQVTTVIQKDTRVDSLIIEFNNYKQARIAWDSANAYDIYMNENKITILSELLLMTHNRADSLYNVARLGLIFAFEKIDTLNKKFDIHKHQVIAYDTMVLQEINYFEFYPGDTYEDSILYKNIIDSVLKKMFYNVIIHGEKQE